MDSDIAASIMKRFVEAARPILVVHDSFLVQRRDEQMLRRSMVEEFQAVVATNFEPKIK